MSSGIQLENNFQINEKSDEIQFWIGNPTVELTTGRLMFTQNPSNLVVCISIPNSQQPIEFCDFVQEFLGSIVELKVLMIESSNYYAVLMMFTNSQQSQRFFQSKNNTQFNALEEDTCLSRYVSKVLIDDCDSGSMRSIFYQKGYPKHKKQQSKKKNNYNSDQCTICFEPLSDQSLNTIISILCGHYFHLKCLLQWNQPICPLCRYEQQPPEIAFCEVCTNAESLWMCLTCGAKLCEDHRPIHYHKIQHSLYLNITTKLVWDSISMNYVHRTLLSEFGGKLIQHEGQQGLKDYESKLDQFLKEQEQLLYTSLDSQRGYFEQVLNELQSKQIKLVKQLESESSELQEQLEIQQNNTSDLEKQYIQEEEEFKQMKLQFIQQHQSLGKLEKENDELSQSINKIEQEQQFKANKDIENLRELKSQTKQIQDDIKEMEQNIKLRQKVKKEGLNQMDIESSQVLFKGKSNKNQNKRG